MAYHQFPGLEKHTSWELVPERWGNVNAVSPQAQKRGAPSLIVGLSRTAKAGLWTSLKEMSRREKDRPALRAVDAPQMGLHSDDEATLGCVQVHRHLGSSPRVRHKRALLTHPSLVTLVAVSPASHHLVYPSCDLHHPHTFPLLKHRQAD